MTLNPIASPGNGLAMVAIPISDSEVIVIESRRKLGYDVRLAAEGVLVYTVNASIAIGQLPIRVAGKMTHPQAEDRPQLIDDYPLLGQGQSVTVRGYTITVDTATYNTDTILIKKTGNP